MSESSLGIDFDESNSASIEESKITEIQVPKKVYTFQGTPLMSTYLIGLAVGEFDCIESESTVRIWPDDSNEENVDKSTLPTKKVPMRMYTPLGRGREVKYQR